MKTDELIAMLANNAGPVPEGASQRFALALGWGALGAVLLMAVLLGVRGDVAAAALLPMFWVKLAYPLSMALAALVASERLSRPGMMLRRVPLALGAPVAAMGLLGVLALLGANAGERDALLFGQSAAVCPFNIALLSVPVLAASLWAMRGLAPTRLALAGGATGLLAGAVGAAAYALNCTEMAAPFLGIWYLLGMLIPAAAGALAAPWLLRW